MSKESDKAPFEKLTVELPVRYWITTLALLDDHVNRVTGPEFQKLKKEGKTPADLTDGMRGALMGPLVARSVIIDALANAGVITPEAKQQKGMEAIYQWAEEGRKMAEAQKAKK